MLEQRIEQLRSQTVGLEALKDSKDELARSFQEELEDIRALLDQGFADKNRSRDIGGTGLGLAIVKHIIEAHDQSINVRSTKDVGSTFSFILEKAG